VQQAKQGHQRAVLAWLEAASVYVFGRQQRQLAGQGGEVPPAGALCEGVGQSLGGGGVGQHAVQGIEQLLEGREITLSGLDKGLGDIPQ
jgi:hypothetical protein